MSDQIWPLSPEKETAYDWMVFRPCSVWNRIPVLQPIDHLQNAKDAMKTFSAKIRNACINSIEFLSGISVAVGTKKELFIIEVPHF
jgi:hypothetical protein